MGSLVSLIGGELQQPGSSSAPAREADISGFLGEKDSGLDAFLKFVGTQVNEPVYVFGRGIPPPTREGGRSSSVSVYSFYIKGASSGTIHGTYKIKVNDETGDVVFEKTYHTPTSEFVNGRPDGHFYYTWLFIR